MSGSPFGVLEYFGAKKSSDVQAEAAQSANQLQWNMFQQSREDQAPWRESGQRAIGTLESKMTAGPGEFNPEEEPGYKFGYEEFVEKPTLRASAATGMSQSGQTLKSLSRYASDYASTKYDNFLDRYYKSLDPYMRLAGYGSNVAVSGGNQAIATGQGMAQNTLAGGQARASGYINQANVLGNQFTNFNRNALDMYAMNSNPSSSWGGWGSTAAGSGAGADSMIWL